MRLLLTRWNKLGKEAKETWIGRVHYTTFHRLRGDERIRPFDDDGYSLLRCGVEPAREAAVERLWQAARFLPQSVRLLGTRYRSLFVAYAQLASPQGEAPAVADALAFVDFMFKQSRVGLLDPEQRALKRDAHALRRRYRLKRKGDAVSAVEKWKILQWLSF